MKKNKSENLRKAKAAKNDEFYTQLVDIERELVHYKDHFKDKVILCNCDDPLESNFFKYFFLNFRFLGLKELITTCYKSQGFAKMSKQDSGRSAKYIRIKRDDDFTTVGDSKVVMKKLEELLSLSLKDNEKQDEETIAKFDENKQKLAKETKNLKPDKQPALFDLIEDNGQNNAGDFRSQACIELLKEADIVVTNPPFSLFREYVAQLMEYGKKFIIIGNPNAISYKEIFTLIKDGKLWLGYKSTGSDQYFHIPEAYQKYLVENKQEGSAYRIIDGEIMGRVSCVWFTNLDIRKRHEDLETIFTYAKTPEKYPKYDNYDAINVDKVIEIPMDYEGLMGVPITYLDKHNPEQFEILGLGSGEIAAELGVTRNYRGRTDLSLENSKCPYHRLIIRKIKQNEGETNEN